MQYRPILMDHFLNPRNVGHLADATGSGIARYPTCGDVTRIFVRVENGVVAAATFQASGCGPGIASSSMLTGMVIGRTVAEAEAITPEDVASAIELPRPKMHTAELAVDALQAALRDSQAREGGEAP